MAGTIALAHDDRWSVAGWLFDWTVELLSDKVTDPDVASELREIVRENLGWVGLDDYKPEIAAELRAVLRDQLVPTAEERLPETLPERQAVIESLQDLAAKAARRPGRPGLRD